MRLIVGFNFTSNNVIISGLLQFSVKKTLGKTKSEGQKKEENEEKPQTNTVVEIKKIITLYFNKFMMI